MNLKYYHTIITETWRFFRKHAENFTNWDEVVREAEQFRAKYTDEFARSELMSKVYELERLYR